MDATLCVPQGTSYATEGPDSLVQAQLMTLTSEAQQWNERLEAAGAIAAGLQAQVGAFETECGHLRGTLQELQVCRFFPLSIHVAMTD